MNPKLLRSLVRGGIATITLLLGSGLWYYCWGRHPHLVVSQAISEKEQEPVCLHVAPGEVVMVSGKTARLFDTSSGKEKWSADLSASGPAVTGATAVPPTPSTDPRVAKLTTWRDELTKRRTSLKTAKEIQAFNVEAAKYHAELAIFRGQSAPAAAPGNAELQDGKANWDGEILRKRQAREAERVRLQGLKVAELKTKAKTDFQRQMAREEEARYTAAQAALSREAAVGKERNTEPAETESTSVEDEEEERYAHIEEGTRTEIVSLTGAIWVVRGKEAIALNKSTGQITRKFTLPGAAQRTWAGAANLYVLVETGHAQQIVRISGTDPSMVAQPLAARCETKLGEFGEAVIRDRSTTLALAGETLLLVDARLLEKKVTTRKAMRGSSTEDWEKADREGHGGWANDALLISQAMENDAKRDLTGGVERLDESTYDVAITQPFEGGKPLWHGTVTGHPELYSLPSLELLVCGTRVLALDRAGTQLWEAKLAWELGKTGPAPCLEADGCVYLYDRAFLTALQRETGKVLWRLPSVGIQKVTAEAGGAIFVCTQNAPADSARYSQESHLATKQQCAVLKVEGKTGKVLWNAPKFENCFVAGGAIYASREVQNAVDPAEQVFARKAPTTRFLLFKLSNGTGLAQWEWLQMRKPLQVEPEGRTVSLLFADEFQALRSFAL